MSPTEISKFQPLGSRGEVSFVSYGHQLHHRQRRLNRYDYPSIDTKRILNMVDHPMKLIGALSWCYLLEQTSLVMKGRDPIMH